MAMTLRTDPDFEAAIIFLAEHDGASKQEAIRVAVIEKAQRLGHQARVAELSREMKERWAGTLDRLGSV